MKAVLIGLSAFFTFLILRAYLRSYLRFRKFSKDYKNEYVKVLSSDECKVKGRFE